MTTAMAGRRKSAGGPGANQVIGSSGMSGVANGGGGGGKQRSNASGPSKPTGGANRSRIDSALMMSTKAQKSSDDVKDLAGHARHNKSSDRLHRLGGGSSTTSLSHHKRNKSYSQVMSAGAGALGSSGKKKKREEKKEEEDGWTSSSQKGTPDHGSPKSGSEDGGDEGALVMGAKAKDTLAGGQEEGTTPKDRQSAPKQLQPPESMKQSDIQVTRRGFQTTPTQDNVALPPQPTQADGRQERESSDSQAHSRTNSDETLAHGTPTPGTDDLARQLRPSTDRSLSSASGQPSSPASIRSKASIRSIRSRSSLYPKESQGPAAPKLSTQYALAGALGSLQEDSELEQVMMNKNPRRRFLSDVGLKNSASEPSHLKDGSVDSVPNRPFASGSRTSAGRTSSISSIQSTTINLPGASPSMADVSMGAVKGEQSQQGAGSAARDAIHRASASSFLSSEEKTQHERRRTTSTQSFSATDAANLATRLRMARGESFDEAHTTSASKLLANSSSKYFTLSGRNDAAGAKAIKEYNKPTVSVFVNRMGERKNFEVAVEPASLFADDFSRPRLQARKGEREEEAGQGSEGEGSEEESEPPSVRYVMDFGLSGPAVQKTETTEALLGTLLDHDEFEATWAPALANAAGLGEGTRKAREAAREALPMDSLHLNGINSTGGVAVNGPNATPMHFLHGLTNTTDAPFPLDPSDLAAGSHAAVMHGGGYLDAKNLRAIAMTWTALNVNKSHVVTRRYVDPMRESVERVGRASGLLGSKGHHPSASAYGAPFPPGSGSTTPGGSLRWSGWRNLFSEHHTLREEV